MNLGACSKFQCILLLKGICGLCGRNM